jgi:hypothetical protein
MSKRKSPVFDPSAAKKLFFINLLNFCAKMAKEKGLDKAHYHLTGVLELSDENPIKYMAGFDWSQTPEGHGYWTEVYDYFNSEYSERAISLRR